MEVDPNFITTEQWETLGTLTTTLWLNIMFAIVIAFDYMIAHAVIPSLVASGHLPPGTNRIRPLFYAISIGTLIAFIAFLISRVELVQVVFDIYDVKWY